MAEPPLWYKYKNSDRAVIVNQQDLVSGKTYFLIGTDTKTGFVTIMNNGKEFERVNDTNDPPLSIDVNKAGTFYEVITNGGGKKSRRNKSRRNKSRRNKKTRKNRRKINRRR
jgi:hypothetical protein